MDINLNPEMLKLAAVDAALDQALAEKVQGSPEMSSQIDQAIEQTAKEEGRDPEDVAKDVAEVMKQSMASDYFLVMSKLAEQPMLADKDKETKTEKNASAQGSAARSLYSALFGG